MVGQTGIKHFTVNRIPYEVGIAKRHSGVGKEHDARRRDPGMLKPTLPCRKRASFLACTP